MKIEKKRLATIIVEIIAIAFILMSIVSYFGDFAFQIGNDQMTTFGFQYWIKDGWSITKATSDGDKTYMLFFLLGFIVFFACAIGTVLTGIFAIINCVKGLLDKENTRFIGGRASGLIAAFGVFYYVFAFLTKCRYSQDANSTISTYLGWGAILFYIFFALLLIANLIRRVVMNEGERYSNKFGVIREAILMAGLVAFIIVGFNNLGGYKQITMGNSSRYYSPFVGAQIFGETMGISKFPVLAFMLGLISSFATVFALLMLCFALYQIFDPYTKKEKYRTRSFLIRAGVFYIASFILLLVATNNYVTSEIVVKGFYGLSISVFPILGIIILIIGVGLHYLFEYLYLKKEKSNTDTAQK